MAIIVTIANQKGGVGKSCIALNLSAAFAELPARVLLVDCDFQQTSVKIAAGAPADHPFPATVIGLPKAEDGLGSLLKPQVPNYDFIVIDGPPSHFSKVTRAAVALADIVLLPTIPSKQDLLSTEETAEIIKNLETLLDRPIRAFVVLNQTERTRMKRMVDEVLAETISYPATKTQIRKRTSYREAASFGRSVLEMGDPEAAQDMRALREEVLSHVR